MPKLKRTPEEARRLREKNKTRGLYVGRQETKSGTCRRIRLFADSNSDFLDPKWSVETLARFLDAIRLAPNIDVILITKHIEKFHERLFLVWGNELNTSPLFEWCNDWVNGRPPSNVWLYVNVEKHAPSTSHLNSDSGA